MKLQKAPGSKPQHPKKLQIPKFQIRTTFWNFEDCDFLGTWGLELFKTPLLPLHYSICYLYVKKPPVKSFRGGFRDGNFRYAIPSDCSVG